MYSNRPEPVFSFDLQNHKSGIVLRYIMKKATIVYIIDPDTQEVLMAKKTRKVGVGYWFGYGGKIDPDETPKDCTIRETYTETGEKITLMREQLEPVALIDFYNEEKMVPGTDDPSFRVLFYRALVAKGTIGTAITTDEMADPTWFRITQLPWKAIMPGDELFIPQVLLGAAVKGWVHFSDGTKTVIGYDLKKCASGDLVI